MRPRWWMALGLLLLGAAQIIPRRPWRRLSSPASADPATLLQPSDARGIAFRDESLTAPVPAALIEPGAIMAPRAIQEVPRAVTVALARGEEREAEGSGFWVWLGYPLAILVAEMTVSQSAEQGIEIHLVLLATLICHAMLTASRDRPLLLALSLVPISRIAGLTAAAFSPSGYYWYLIAFAPLLLAGTAVAKMNALSRAALNLRVPSVTVQIAVALLGIPLGVVGYLILQPPPEQLQPSVGDMLLPALILIVCTGFIEEFVFRGVLQSTAIAMMGRTGILYATVAFAMLRVGTGSLAFAVFMFLAGLLIARLVLDTGSLLGVSLARGLASVMVFLVMPFLSWEISIGLPSPPIATPVSQPPVVPDPSLAVHPEGSRSQGSIMPAAEPGPESEPAASPTIAPTPATETPSSVSEEGGAVPANMAPTPETSTVPAPEPEAGGVLGEAPDPVPEATPGPQCDTEDYLVQPGDTLFRIGVKHGATLDLMRSLNPGQSDQVVPGQRLVVPVGFPRRWVPYAVQPDDTLVGLAVERGTTAEVVAEVNGIDEGQALEPGQQILLPPPR